MFHIYSFPKDPDFTELIFDIFLVYHNCNSTSYYFAFF